MLWFLTGGVDVRAPLHETVRVWRDGPHARYQRDANSDPAISSWPRTAFPTLRETIIECGTSAGSVRRPESAGLALEASEWLVPRLSAVAGTAAFGTPRNEYAHASIAPAFFRYSVRRSMCTVFAAIAARG
ncbi:MAG: hypothetical protein ABW173_11365 [Sphingomonas sp.]